MPPPGVSAAHSLRKFAAAPPRRSCGPCGSRFPTLRCKVPRPHRSADADFLVKPFSGVLVRGISPSPCLLRKRATFSTPAPAAAPSPAWLSPASTSARCEPFLANSLLPGPPTCPARPSAASVAARCEPFSPNRLTPASRDSGSGPDTMAAGARKQAASCDAFVLSRRRPAPDAPLISFAKIRGFKVADYSPCPAPCPAGLAVESPPMRGTSTDV